MQLPDLRNKLPHKWAETLYERLEGKYSKSYILKVVAGIRNSMEIYDAAIALAEEEKKRQQEILEEIHERVSAL